MTTEIRPITADASSIDRTLARRPVLWVGAGLSLGAGYPSTNAILDALIAVADDPIDRSDSFYRVVDEVVASVGTGRVRDVLQRLFQPARPPTPLHRALARLAKTGVFSAIVTTNYDDLLERALAEHATPYVLQPLEGNATIQGSSVRPLKIHGSYHDWANVVLSGRSYDQFATRNPFLSKQLEVLLRQQPILFLGCSLQDPRILDWLASRSVEEREGLKEWRAVMTEAAWQVAVAHNERGLVTRELFASANLRPLLVENHNHARKLFVDAAAKLPTATEVITLEFHVTATQITAKLDGAPDWTPADLVGDEPFQTELQELRAVDHRPLASNDKGSVIGRAAEVRNWLYVRALRLGRQLATEMFSPAALGLLRHAIGASQAGIPPLLQVQVHTSDDAESQARADRLLALPWELLEVESQFPVERGKLDVARAVAKVGAPGLSPPDQPLTVVAAVAAPRDTSRLDYESECYRLWTAMGAEEGRLHITDDGQLATVVRAMAERRPQVLHFTGHGAPNALLFEDEQACSDKVLVRTLIDKLRLDGLPRLVFLASCHGATQAQATQAQAIHAASTRLVRDVGVAPTEDLASRDERACLPGYDPAWSSAAELQREGVDQVVAWFGPVGDRQCTRAETTFYAALAAGKTARQAVREARQASREPLRLGPGSEEWAVYPLGWAQIALYHRGADVPTALPASAAPAPALERARVMQPLGPTRHGIGGVEQLRFGFVGRRSTRAEILQRFGQGQRLLVITGLGGLGKTALCATMAPILARRLTPASAQPLILAIDGRTAGAAATPLHDLWAQVAVAMKEWRAGDDVWVRRADTELALRQKDGLSGHALTKVLAWWCLQAGSAVIYIDDAESLMARLPDADELGKWSDQDLTDFWLGLCSLATVGGGIAVLASARYRPKELSPEAHVPLPALADIDLVHLLSWWPTLGRLRREAKQWVVERLQGHPRSVEWLEALLRQNLEELAPPGDLTQHPIDLKTVAELLPPLAQQLDEDLLLPRLFDAVGPSVRNLVLRASLLSRPAPWLAVLALQDEADTARRAQAAGLLSPFEGLGDSRWGVLPMVRAKAGSLTSEEERATHARLGTWFHEQWLRGRDALGWAEPAAHHLLASGQANAAWEPTQHVVGGLRDAGRYREALAWVQRVLVNAPSGPERGLALTFEAQLRMFTGDRAGELEQRLTEALGLVELKDQTLVLREFGSFHYYTGQLKKAVNALAKALKAATAPSVAAATLHEFARVLQAQEKFSGARNLLERALHLERRALGTEDHLDIAVSFHQLAHVLHDQDDLPAARDHLERALGIYERVLGTEDHPNVAVSLHELARVFRDQGDLPTARHYFERALRIETKMHGTEDHPDIAASHQALARLLRAEGDLPGARDHLERALNIEQRLYGAGGHWQTAIIEASLAGVLLQYADPSLHARAMDLLRHAHQTLRHRLGETHPRTVEVRQRLEHVLAPKN